ncbi:hypothetical protein Q3G72_008120 [Acer saccharum]|nr:hypothetical protein Q3G72_008120 [Acer saccharum]
MESLRLLSLQGISGIEELPNSIMKLINLRILDLKARYNLESLPKEIKSIKMLTHLDVSDHGNICTLADLAGLNKLRKLSINVCSETFLIDELSATLFKFNGLQKLNIAWGGGSKAKEKGEAKSKAAKEVLLLQGKNGKAENVFRKCNGKAENNGNKILEKLLVVTRKSYPINGEDIAGPWLQQLAHMYPRKIKLSPI